MKLPLCALVVLYLLVEGCGAHKQATKGQCHPRDSCDECIEQGPNCAWCKQQNFTKAGEQESSRCDSQQNLVNRGCVLGEVMNPNGTLLVTERSQGRPGETLVQLTPQRISLSLRPGEEKLFTVKFTRAQGYPIDLYYLMDLSYSMKDDLENIKKLGSDLLAALRNVTEAVKIGFGSFVDKTVLPYISTTRHKLRNPCPDRTEQCQPPFSFHHVLPLTNNSKQFEAKVSQQRISGNVDSPEGGLDAIMQAAVCVGEVGWRDVTKLLVYTSDDTFHTAGDGRLGSVYLPNDGRCHLSPGGEYSNANLYDYPSVGHLAQVLSERNIQPIFAVTKKSLPVYQSLSKLIPKSAVGELQEDSSNVIQLILDAYNNLSSTIDLVHTSLPEGVTVLYDSHCNDQSGTERADRGKCSNVHIKEEITFTVHISLTHCLSSEQRFEIRPLGFNERLEVRVQSLCSCDCGDPTSLTPHSHCSHGNGTLKCGVCSCAAGRLGKWCECTNEPDARPLSEGCRRKTEESEELEQLEELCSGQGECVCGQCVCQDKIHGEFCQCDDHNCERHNGKLCGGNGQCKCGQCDCNTNYTGSACACPLTKDQCSLPGGTECSGHGLCQCNECQCDPGYQHPVCATCPTCCDDVKVCVECLVFGDCETDCGHVSQVQELRGTETACTQSYNQGRSVTFSVNKHSNNYQVKVHSQEGYHDRSPIIITSVVAGIVVIGLLLVVVLRASAEIYDRRDYQRFERDRMNERWHDATNPLYKSATTTTVNPKFGGE